MGRYRKVWNELRGLTEGKVISKLYLLQFHIFSQMPGLDFKTDPALLDDFMPWSQKIPDYCRNKV